MKKKTIFGFGHELKKLPSLKKKFDVINMYARFTTVPFKPSSEKVLSIS